MDLKDVVEKVKYAADEAHSAFHAGHQVVAKRYLNEASETIRKYFDEFGMPAGDVTETAASEQPAQDQPGPEGGAPESPAEPALPATQFLGSNIGQVISSPKPPQ